MATFTELQSIDNPKKAVYHLRDLSRYGYTIIDWSFIEKIASLHFGDTFPQLKLCFTHRIDTCLASMFEEEAGQLMKTLPKTMTALERPTRLEEGEMLAYRITLLQILASIVRALHNKDTIILRDGHLAT